MESRSPQADPDSREVSNQMSTDKNKKIVLVKGSDLVDPEKQDETINKILDDLLGPEEKPAEDPSPKDQDPK